MAHLFHFFCVVTLLKKEVFCTVKWMDLPWNSGWVGWLNSFAETDNLVVVTKMVSLSTFGEEVTEVMPCFWPLPFSTNPPIWTVGMPSWLSLRLDTVVRDFKTSLWTWVTRMVSGTSGKIWLFGRSLWLCARSVNKDWGFTVILRCSKDVVVLTAGNRNPGWVVEMVVVYLEFLEDDVRADETLGLVVVLLVDTEVSYNTI